MVPLSSRIENVHALSAASHPTTLLHAVKLAAAGVLRLALHVVIVVVAASGADEERCRQERRGAGTNLLDSRDVVRERRGVDEDFLMEPTVEWLARERFRPFASNAILKHPAKRRYAQSDSGRERAEAEDILRSSGRHVVCVGGCPFVEPRMSC